MKRLIIICVMGICMLGPLPIYAQQDEDYVNSRKVDFGFRAGLNVSSFSDDKVLDAEWLTGVHLGFYGRYTLTRLLAIKGELSYSMQGARADKFSVFEKYAINLNYLNIPVLAEVSLGQAVKLELGSYIGILLASRQSFKELTRADTPLEVIEEDTNSIDLGLAAGLSIKMSEAFDVGVRYNHGFIDALGSDFYGNAAGQNSVIQISGIYSF